MFHSFARPPCWSSEKRHFAELLLLSEELVRTLVFPTFGICCFWKVLFQKEMIPMAAKALPVGWGPGEALVSGRLVTALWVFILPVA